MEKQFVVIADLIVAIIRAETKEEAFDIFVHNQCHDPYKEKGYKDTILHEHIDNFIKWLNLYKSFEIKELTNKGSDYQLILNAR